MSFHLHPAIPARSLFFSPTLWLLTTADHTGRTSRYIFTNEHVALEHAYSMALADATTRVYLWHDGALIFRSC